MSDVYFLKLKDGCSLSDQIKATKDLIQTAGMDKVISNRDKVGVKIHVGEKNNDTHVSPEVIKAICSRIKRNGAFPFLTETSTLYRGQRSNAIDHLNHAYTHGFTPENVGVPFIIADGLVGNSEIRVKIPGKIFREVNIAREIAVADALIAVTHVTGHMQSGLGAGIKNLGMGLASRMGKMRQHSSIMPSVNTTKCTFCKTCMKWCPESCITQKDDKAFILQEQCIGCGECLAVCKFNAVQYNWGVASGDMQKKMAEHALGVVHSKPGKVFFLSYLVDMTRDCDCTAFKQQKVMPDLGLLASTDLVAIDQAAIDLTGEAAGDNISRKSYNHIDPLIQLIHGEAIGLGSRKYKLIQV